MVLNMQPPGVDFQNPATRVRMNPDSYLKFEDGETVTLHNVASEESIRIKYDILLILYPMIHWISVGELCEGWPPEDQEKIKDHLAMLHQGKIIVTSEAELQEKPPSNLPANLGDKICINVENHHVMLRDSIRMACYQRAIEQTINAESVVLDLGAGSGILSFFAARAGAQKVYAIEKRPDMVALATELAKANGFSERVTFIENSSHRVKAESLAPQPTVLVSEILGNAILEENVLEFTIDARDRLLAPGATLIPGKLDIMVAAFDAGQGVDKTQEVAELEAIYGFNLEILKTVLAQKSHLKLERFNPLLYTMMSEPTCAISLDLMTIQSSTFRQTFEITATQEGYINGFVAYFRAHLTEENVLTNSPWAPPTHWTQMVFQFPERRMVQAGETLTMEMVYDGGLALWFKT